MDQKKQLKLLLNKIADGKFGEVLSEIESKNIVVENSAALNIIISCCTACFNNIKNVGVISESELMELLTFSVDKIEVLSDKHVTSYYQSIFHICRLLLLKKSYKAVSNLEIFLLPTFLSSVTLTPNVTTVCEKIWNNLYNFALTEGKSDKNVHDNIDKLIYILMEFGSKFCTAEKYMKQCCSIQLCLVCMKIQMKKHEKIFFHSLKFYSKCTADNNVESAFINYLSYFSDFIMRCQETYEHLKVIEIFKQTLQIIEKHFPHKEIKPLIYILEGCSFICPSNDTEYKRAMNLAKDLCNYYKTHRLNGTFRATCNVIVKFCVVLLFYSKNYLSDNWPKIPTEVQLKIYNFFNTIVQFKTSASHKCTSNECNYYETMKLFKLICKLGILYFSQVEKADKQYKTEYVKYLEQAVNKVSFLKEQNCVNWKNYWQDVGLTIYNIGVYLNKNNDTDYVIYFKKFVIHSLKLEGFEASINGSNLIPSALNKISNFYFESKDFNTSLTIVAYTIAVFPVERKNLVLKWIQNKCSARGQNCDENLQELTIVSALLKSKSHLEGITSDANLTKTQQIELLIFELESYKTKWKSKLPMMVAFKELTAIADPFVCAQTFVKIWGDCSLEAHKNLPNLLKQTLQKYERCLIKQNCNDFESSVYLGHLYFLQYKYQVQEAILENYHKLVPAQKNDEDACDIVTSYQSLKLEAHILTSKSLIKSLDILSTVIKEDCIKFTTLDGFEVFKLLEKIALEYRLHKKGIFSLQAWKLALIIAENIKSNSSILTALSYLIENSDVDNNYIKQLMSLGDKLVKGEGVSTSALTYYIFKAQALLLTDSKLAAAIYEKADKLFKKFCELEINVCVKARLKMLHTKLSMLPCKFSTDEHKKRSLVHMHMAYAMMVDFYKECTGSISEEKSVIFEIVEFLGKIYLELRKPREVRAYCKEAIILSQQLILPLRSAALLVYLAEADLLAYRLDDAKVKIEGLEDILCLSTCKAITPQKSRQKEPSKENIAEEIETISNDLKEIMLLDLPVKTHYQQTSSSSPVLHVESFSLPSFLKHATSCKCLYCNCLEYQELVIYKTNLEALLCSLKKDYELAEEFFIGSLKIYNNILHSSDHYLKRIEKILPEDLITLPKVCLIDPYCKVLLNYSVVMLKLNNDKSAADFNTKLLKHLAACKLQHIYLYNEALTQKLTILSKSLTSNKKQNSDLLNVDNNDERSVEIKTPESNRNIVILNRTRSPLVLTPQKRVLKSIQINLDFNEEVDDKSSKPQTNQPSFFKCTKTPALKIYSSPLTSVKCSKTKPKKGLGNKLNVGFVDEVPNSHDLPTNPVTMKKLRSKTKLLTEKLKQNSSASDNENKPSASNTKKVRTARLNLAKEINEVQSIDVQTGAIRKSTRKK